MSIIKLSTVTEAISELFKSFRFGSVAEARSGTAYRLNGEAGEARFMGQFGPNAGPPLTSFFTRLFDTTAQPPAPLELKHEKTKVTMRREPDDGFSATLEATDDPGRKYSATEVLQAVLHAKNLPGADTKGIKAEIYGDNGQVKKAEDYNEEDIYNLLLTRRTAEGQGLKISNSDEIDAILKASTYKATVINGIKGSVEKNYRAAIAPPADTTDQSVEARARRAVNDVDQAVVEARAGMAGDTGNPDYETKLAEEIANRETDIWKSVKNTEEIKYEDLAYHNSSYKVQILRFDYQERPFYLKQGNGEVLLINPGKGQCTRVSQEAFGARDPDKTHFLQTQGKNIVIEFQPDGTPEQLVVDGPRYSIHKLTASWKDVQEEYGFSSEQAKKLEQDMRHLRGAIMGLELARYIRKRHDGALHPNEQAPPRFEYVPPAGFRGFFSKKDQDSINLNYINEGLHVMAGLDQSTLSADQIKALDKMATDLKDMLDTIEGRPHIKALNRPFVQMIDAVEKYYKEVLDLDGLLEDKPTPDGPDGPPPAPVPEGDPLEIIWGHIAELEETFSSLEETFSNEETSIEGKLHIRYRAFLLSAMEEIGSAEEPTLEQLKSREWTDQEKERIMIAYSVAFAEHARVLPELPPPSLPVESPSELPASPPPAVATTGKKSGGLRSLLKSSGVLDFLHTGQLSRLFGNASDKAQALNALDGEKLYKMFTGSFEDAREQYGFQGEALFYRIQGYALLADKDMFSGRECDGGIIRGGHAVPSKFKLPEAVKRKLNKASQAVLTKLEDANDKADEYIKDNLTSPRDTTLRDLALRCSELEKLRKQYRTSESKRNAVAGLIAYLQSRAVSVYPDLKNDEAAPANYEPVDDAAIAGGAVLPENPEEGGEHPELGQPA